MSSVFKRQQVLFTALFVLSLLLSACGAAGDPNYTAPEPGLGFAGHEAAEGNYPVKELSPEEVEALQPFVDGEANPPEAFTEVFSDNMSREVSEDDTAVLQPFLAGEAPPPEVFTSQLNKEGWELEVEFYCDRFEVVQNGTHTIQVCKEAIMALTEETALFMFLVATPTPFDEAAYGARWVGKVFNADNAFKALIFIGAATLVVDGAQKIDFELTPEVSSAGWSVTHSSSDHDPAVAGSTAQTLVSNWNNMDPNEPNKKCGTVYDAAGNAVRLIMWVYTHTSASGGINPTTGLLEGGARRGNIVWAWVKGNVAGGGYTNVAEKSLTIPPKDLVNHTIEMEPCDGWPPIALP